MVKNPPVNPLRGGEDELGLMDGEQNAGSGSETSQVGAPCAWAVGRLPTEAVHLEVLGAHPGGRLGRKLGDSVAGWCTDLEVLLITSVHIPLCELCSVTWPHPGNIRVSFLAFRDISWGQGLRKMCHQQKGLLGRSQVAACSVFRASFREEKLLQDLANKYLLISCLN